jgi:hypothetical protein
LLPSDGATLYLGSTRAESQDVFTCTRLHGDDDGSHVQWLRDAKMEPLRVGHVEFVEGRQHRCVDDALGDRQQARLYAIRRSP